jgi:hypothetical protein
MYHLIEFNSALTLEADLKVAGKQRPEPLRIRRATRARVRLCPCVFEMHGELIEAADLYFEEGVVAFQVPYECFHFVE